MQAMRSLIAGEFLFGRCLRHDLVDGRPRGRGTLAGWGRAFLQHTLADVAVAPVEGVAAREQSVDDHPEPVDIGGVVDAAVLAVEMLLGGTPGVQIVAGVQGVPIGVQQTDVVERRLDAVAEFVFGVDDVPGVDTGVDHVLLVECNERAGEFAGVGKGRGSPSLNVAKRGRFERSRLRWSLSVAIRVGGGYTLKNVSQTPGRLL